MKTLRIILIVLSLGLLILRCVNQPMLLGISPALLAAIAIALILWEDGVRISNYRRIGRHGTEYVSHLVEVEKEDRTFRHEAMFGENYHLLTEIELAGKPEGQYSKR